jgi:hypothetical protein
MNYLDPHGELTPELASQMAVVAVTTDVEFWARTVSVKGRVGLDELTRTLETIRLAADPRPDAHDSAIRTSLPEAKVDLR